MKRATRTATEHELPDLVETPPRAHLAFVVDGFVEAVPVACARTVDGWSIRSNIPVPSGRATLVIDDGVYYFDLRGLRYPGMIDAPALGASEQRFVPDKVIGWDYGSMRQATPS